MRRGQGEWRKETTFKCRGDGGRRAVQLAYPPYFDRLSNSLSAIGGEALKRKVRYLIPPSLSLPRCALALPLVSLSLGIAPSAIVLDHPESIMNRGFQDRPNPISVGAASSPNIAGVIFKSKSPARLTDRRSVPCRCALRNVLNGCPND